MTSESDNNNNNYNKALIKVINKIKEKDILVELLKRIDGKKNIKNLFKTYKKGIEIELLLSKSFNKIDKNEVKKIINKKIKYIDEEKEKIKKKIEKAEKLLTFLKDYHILDIALKNIKENGGLATILSNVKNGKKIGPLLQEMTDKKSIDELLNVIKNIKKNNYQISEKFGFGDFLSAINPIEIAKSILRAIPGFSSIEDLIFGMIDIMIKLPQIILDMTIHMVPLVLKILPYIFDLFTFITTKFYSYILNIGAIIQNILANTFKYPIPTALSAAFFLIAPKKYIKDLIGFNVEIPYVDMIFAIICVVDLLLNDYYNVTVLNKDGTTKTIHIFKYIESLIESTFKYILYIFDSGLNMNMNININGILKLINENKVTTIIMIISSLIFIKSFVINISEYLN